MKTNSKLALATVIGFLVGGAAGFFFRGAEITPDLAQGDISKASKFNKNVVSPAMSAFQEKITSNPEELEKATASLTVLTSRMTEFDELVKIAAAASEGKEELAASLKDLLSVKQLAANARTSGNLALEALNAITEGKKSSVDYEQASQNLALAFMMVDRQISVGKQYVCDVDAFLRGKDIEDYKELALARDLWAGYCAGEAVLTNNSEELAYWNKQQNLLTSSSNTLAAMEQLDKYATPALLQCMSIDGAVGLVKDGTFLVSNIEQAEKFSDVKSNEQIERVGTDIQGMLSNSEVQEITSFGAQGKILNNSEIGETVNVSQLILSAVPVVVDKFLSNSGTGNGTVEIEQRNF